MMCPPLIQNLCKNDGLGCKKMWKSALTGAKTSAKAHFRDQTHAKMSSWEQKYHKVPSLEQKQVQKCY